MSRLMPLTVTAALIVTAVVVLLIVSDDSRPGEIVVSRSALDAMGSYAFESEARIEFMDGTTFQATFVGHHQPPDRLQGDLTVTGESLGFASETEVVLIGQESWGRERGGTWEAGVQYSFLTLASPWFYIDSLHFDALRLSTAGPVEVVNGVEAYQVLLDKDDVLGLLSQATAFGLVPDTDDRAMERAMEDAAAWLPDDFTVETWIAVDGTYPVRLEIRMSGGSEGFAFIESAESVRLEMDITDVNVDVQIEPPTPIATDLE